MLHAVDRRTGELRWKFDARADGGQPEFHGRPLVTEKMIVVASDDRRPEGVGYVYAFDRSSMAPVWKYRADPGVMTDLQQWQNGVFFVTLLDELVMLDLASGRELWKYATGAHDDNFPPDSSPALSGPIVFGEPGGSIHKLYDFIVFGGRDGSLQAVSANSGGVVWRTELGSRVSTSVLLLGRNAYAGDDAGRLHRLDAATGKEIAQIQINGSLTSAIVPTDSSLLVFSHDEDGVVTLHSIPATLDRPGWERRAAPPGWTSFSRAYLWNGTVVVGRETGDFTALSLSNGQPVWAGRVTGRIAGLGGDDSLLYVGTTGGTLYGYRLPGHPQ